jgi:hypothetical protein
MNNKKLCFKKFHSSAWTQKKICKEIPYVSMDTKEDMLSNSIRQHGHKIRHVKEIPYVSMNTK